MARRHKPRTARPTGAIPEALWPRLHALLGNELPALQHALEEPPPVSIRLNPAKPGGPEGEPVPWCATGRYLPERPLFTLDPALHAGAYYVQEASSMLIAAALEASGLLHRPILALDLCAAPGGKSTLLRSMLHPQALLVANEVEGKRQAALQENLWKWGLPNVAVTGSGPQDLEHLPDSFDLIVVDAPCSGEGLFRKDAFARAQWSERLVDGCATTQRHIVEQAWQALRPGGVLLYSTCTWEVAENEERLAQLAQWGVSPLPVPAATEWGMVPVERDGLVGLRCYPHRVRGEGFFLAAVRKPGEAPSPWPEDAPPQHDRPEVRAWLQQPDRWYLQEHRGVLHAVDARWAPTLDRIRRALRMLAPGRPVAEMRGPAWSPHAALALDTSLNMMAFPTVELDRDTALRYLRGEALRAHDVHGTALARHAGLSLGWLHGAGQRWNNGWPAPWRIRMQAS